MFKRLTPAVAALLFLGRAPTAAMDFNLPMTKVLSADISRMDIPVPSRPTADAQAGSVKEWTIMVFVNGKNNLEKYALADVNEMEMIGSTDKVNIVAELGRIAGYDASDGDWVGARRYQVRKDDNTSTITSPVAQDLGNVDMGDYNRVIDFGKWAKANYPAKKYMLIIWNHGSGWNKSIDGAAKGISYDEETGHHLDTPQMGRVLKAIGGVDVYGSDACLMQMPEVAYELKPYVEYIVGSEEIEPGDGYTYDKFLGPVADNPGMTPEELGKQAVNAYADHYADKGATQSLVKASALDGFVTFMDDFVTAAMAGGEKALVKSAITNSQSYNSTSNKDLCDFVSRYAASSQNGEVKAKAAALCAYVKGTLVAHNRATGGYSDWSMGLSVYMPKMSIHPAYKELAWAKAAKWDEFIVWYLSKDAPAVPR